MVYETYMTGSCWKGETEGNIIQDVAKKLTYNIGQSTGNTPYDVLKDVGMKSVAGSYP